MTRKSWLWLGAAGWTAFAMFEVVNGKAYSKLGAAVTRHNDPVTFWASVLIDLICAGVCVWCAMPVSKRKDVGQETRATRSD